LTEYPVFVIIPLSFMPVIGQAHHKQPELLPMTLCDSRLRKERLDCLPELHAGSFIFEVTK